MCLVLSVWCLVSAQPPAASVQSDQNRSRFRSLYETVSFGCLFLIKLFSNKSYAKKFCLKMTDQDNQAASDSGSATQRWIGSNLL